MAGFFQKILGRQKISPEHETDLPVPQQSAIVSMEQKDLSDPLEWEFASAQSVGRQREHNEDALFTYGSHLSFEETQKFIGFFAVADGMGGHANGELASGLAVRTMADQVIKKIFNHFLSSEPGQDPAGMKEILLSATQEANRVVKKHVPGGGTTLTAMVIVDHQLQLIHVGDSRAYAILPDGNAQILTHDHSFVRQLVDMGQISPEEAAVHPQRNILSMAIGQWEPLEPDYVIQPVPEKGHILLCSDGLWGVLTDQKIAEIIHSTGDLRQASQKLVEEANQAGGPDNITVILVRAPG